MAISTDNYFAFADIILYDIIGDVWLFILLGLLIVIFVCAKYQFSIQTTIIASILWLLITIGIVYNYLLYAFVVSAVGFISYYLLSKTFKRG